MCRLGPKQGVHGGSSWESTVILEIVQVKASYAVATAGSWPEELADGDSSASHISYTAKIASIPYGQGSSTKTLLWTTVIESLH